MNEKNGPVVIGLGGLAMSGKDTFVKVAKKILKENGYSSIKLAFADALKEELDPFTKQYYGISCWTNDSEEKKLIRRAMVSHGCIMRDINPCYWINQVDEEIKRIHCEDVVFISDVRFPNEVDWVHNKWNGWFVHLKKYSTKPKQNWTWDFTTQKIVSHPTEGLDKYFDQAPNDEEATNDPICEKKADYKLEMENAIEREQRLKGIKITVDSLIDNTYLNEEIKSCLLKCPFLTLR